MNNTNIFRFIIHTSLESGSTFNGTIIWERNLLYSFKGLNVQLDNSVAAALRPLTFPFSLSDRHTEDRLGQHRLPHSVDKQCRTQKYRIGDGSPNFAIKSQM